MLTQTAQQESIRKFAFDNLLGWESIAAGFRLYIEEAGAFLDMRTPAGEAISKECSAAAGLRLGQLVYTDGGARLPAPIGVPYEVTPVTRPKKQSTSVAEPEQRVYRLSDRMSDRALMLKYTHPSI